MLMVTVLASIAAAGTSAILTAKLFKLTHKRGSFKGDIASWAMEKQIEKLTDKMTIWPQYFAVDEDNKAQRTAYICGELAILEELMELIWESD